MTMPLVLVAVMVVLFACGVYLLLDRTLTRMLLGFLLVGNATNLLIFLMSGSFGEPPLVGEASPEEMSDPLPQAFILTAIVITFGVSAFLLALIYRAWRLAHDHEDTVQDDEDDVELAHTGALTTAEVTDEALAESPELSPDGEVDQSDDDWTGEPVAHTPADLLPEVRSDPTLSDTPPDVEHESQQAAERNDAEQNDAGEEPTR